MFQFTPTYQDFYRQQPSYIQPSYPTPQQSFLNARDNYISALANVKAAEAQYHAAESVQHEEDALRRRLQEIEVIKRAQSIPFSSYDAVPSYQSPISLPTYTSAPQDPLILLRQQVADEGRQAALLSARTQVEQEALLQQQVETERRALELRQAEQAKRIAQLQEEYDSIHQARLQRSDAHRVKFNTLEKSQVPASRNEGLPTQEFSLSSQARKPQTRTVPRQVTFRLPSGPGATGQQTSGSLSDAYTRDLVSQALGAPISSVQPAKPDLADTVTREVASAPDRPTPKDIPHIVESDLDAPSEFFRDLFASYILVQSRPAASSSSNSKPVQPHIPTRDSSKYDNMSLREKLEKQYKNDESVEIHNTIQAILTSLADSQASAQLKGKGKAAPTSKDIADAVSTVRNIDATFTALESEFVLPESLDFVTTSPVFSQSESFVNRLTYSAQNQAVRIYQQSMSRLVSQLDEIDSLGDDALRKRKKEVITRVERALDELTNEIEGRWRSRVTCDSEQPVPSGEPSSDNMGVVRSRDPRSDAPGNISTGQVIVSSEDWPSKKSDVDTSLLSSVRMNQVGEGSQSVDSLGPYNVGANEAELSDDDIDTFLLRSHIYNDTPKKPTVREDRDSDWSEVDASN